MMQTHLQPLTTHSSLSVEQWTQQLIANYNSYHRDGASYCRFCSKHFTALTPSSQQPYEVDTITPSLHMRKLGFKKFK